MEAPQATEMLEFYPRTRGGEQATLLTERKAIFSLFLPSTKDLQFCQWKEAAWGLNLELERCGD